MGRTKLNLDRVGQSEPAKSSVSYPGTVELCQTSNVTLHHFTELLTIKNHKSTTIEIP